MGHRIVRIALILAAVLAVALAGTASANTLHQTPPIIGTQFGSPDCSDGLGTGWVFVNTGSHDATGAVLTATFADAGTVTADGFTPGNGIVHYFVPVSPSDSLLSASDSLNTDGLLNLSHVCYGSETPSPSVTPSTAPSDTPSIAPSDVPRVPLASQPNTATEEPVSSTRNDATLIVFLVAGIGAGIYVSQRWAYRKR